MLDEIKKETIDFIAKNNDQELNQRVADALLPVITDPETKKGSTGKVLCALADFTAKFLHMCSIMTGEKEPVSTSEYGDMFYELLDFFCFAEDHPVDDSNDTTDNGETIDE